MENSNRKIERGDRHDSEENGISVRSDNMDWFGYLKWAITALAIITSCMVIAVILVAHTGLSEFQAGALFAYLASTLNRVFNN